MSYRYLEFVIVYAFGMILMIYPMCEAKEVCSEDMISKK